MNLRRSRTRLLLLAIVASLMLMPRAAPGTVAEQRQRLPPPAECQSPVEGRWKAHVFDANYHDWHMFTLEVRVVEGHPTELRGTIQVEAWDGGAKDEQPPPCQGRIHFTGHMPAQGSYENGLIRFSGKEFKLDKVLCGGIPGYAVDNFSGTIDPKTQEFQSINDDHNRGEQATVFRRIGCFDAADPTPPAVDVTPPPLFPAPADKGHSSGCGCGGFLGAPDGGRGR